MKIIVKCTENVQNYNLVKYNNENIIDQYDNTGSIIGIAQNCKKQIILVDDIETEVNTCELVIFDVAHCVLSTNLSVNGGVVYADNHKISSSGSIQVGYVFPRSFANTSDYQAGDTVSILLR
tara:strand:- start:184 stop:549 length:366 start_codon:yes stop_codon:yes gene_type:complete